MPGFDARDFHIDAFLTNFLHGYRPEGMVADQIFPVINVSKQTNVFARIDLTAIVSCSGRLRVGSTTLT